jgi:phosphoglycolate phosphatase-like HAD superfamily hydrolase
MLIIFDVDGTLIGGEAVDWKCFGDAFTHVTGTTLTPEFWAGIREVTAKAIVHQALSLSQHAPAPLLISQIEGEVSREYVRRLKAAHALDDKAFPPAPGVAQLLQHLDRQDHLKVALATGDWYESITFKLSAAGIDYSRYPVATSSDCYSRADIIRLAAERAGYPITQALYVGDGLWDYRATQQLGIPFLGVGHRHKSFLEAGAPHAMQIVDTEGFMAWLGALPAYARARILS